MTEVGLRAGCGKLGECGATGESLGHALSQSGRPTRRGGHAPHIPHAATKALTNPFTRIAAHHHSVRLLYFLTGQPQSGRDTDILAICEKTEVGLHSPKNCFSKDFTAMAPKGLTVEGKRVFFSPRVRTQGVKEEKKAAWGAGNELRAECGERL